MPLISAVIGTHNRAESPARTLETIEEVIIPEAWSVELLVVDNGSTDQTGTVMKDLRMESVSVRYIREPKPGLCRGRNARLAAASGKGIFSTGNDVRVLQNLFSLMCEPILFGTADVVAGGVRLPPEQDKETTEFDRSTTQSWFACTGNLDLRQPCRMVGANTAFHRRVLDRHTPERQTVHKGKKDRCLPNPKRCKKQ